MFKKIAETIKGIKAGSSWQKKYDANAPKEGGLAPNFSLSDVKGENPITLSQFIDDRPVALVFGSFT